MTPRTNRLLQATARLRFCSIPDASGPPCLSAGVPLRDEWISGANRFSKPGEALFGVFDFLPLTERFGLARTLGLPSPGMGQPIIVFCAGKC
jgi:hypothetical protein